MDVIDDKHLNDTEASDRGRHGSQGGRSECSSAQVTEGDDGCDDQGVFKQVCSEKAVEQSCAYINPIV
jgi:hypothetical protein